MSAENTRLDEILASLENKFGTARKYTAEEWAAKQVDMFNDCEGQLNAIDGYDCPICKNKGVLMKLSEDGREVSYFCRCKNTRDTLLRARRSGLGNILTDYTFDKFIVSEEWQADLKNAAQAFVQDENARCFYLGGQVGAGKTHLCTAICAQYIKKGYETKYMLWNEEAKKLKALITDNAEYQKLMSCYKNADVLYIDDFLKTKKGESPTTADINVAFEIINSRYINRDKITIISSEKTLREVLQYDEATSSRIYQCAGEYKFSIDADINKNYRLK